MMIIITFIIFIKNNCLYNGFKSFKLIKYRLGKCFMVFIDTFL